CRLRAGGRLLLCFRCCSLVGAALQTFWPRDRPHAPAAFERSGTGGMKRPGPRRRRLSSLESPACVSTSMASMDRPHLLFVTGKLAEPALRRTLAELSAACSFDYSIAVLPITVAALATTPWIARHLQVPAATKQVILPGRCGGA